MKDVLYELMDWADIETIVYSEHDNPHSLLGAHITDKGILINAFIPTAICIVAKLTKTGLEYPMICEDEEGFYAVLVPGNKIVPYTFIVTYNNNSSEEISDPY